MRSDAANARPYVAIASYRHAGVDVDHGLSTKRPDQLDKRTVSRPGVHLLREGGEVDLPDAEREPAGRRDSTGVGVDHHDLIGLDPVDKSVCEVPLGPASPSPPRVARHDQDARPPEVGGPLSDLDRMHLVNCVRGR